MFSRKYAVIGCKSEHEPTNQKISRNRFFGRTPKSLSTVLTPFNTFISTLVWPIGRCNIAVQSVRCRKYNWQRVIWLRRMNERARARERDWKWTHRSRQRHVTWRDPPTFDSTKESNYESLINYFGSNCVQYFLLSQRWWFPLYRVCEFVETPLLEEQRPLIPFIYARVMTH